MMKMLIICLAAAVFFSCRQQAQQVVPKSTVRTGDVQLQMKNGILIYRGTVFNGKLVAYWRDSIYSSSQEYEQGRQEGSELSFYENGKRETERWFTKGEKDSVHRGWWANGKPRFEYHFKKGLYNGAFREWYESGGMLQEVMYENGNEVSGKGWRENGKPYMNFIVKDGRRYGLVNANLCFSQVAEKQSK